MQRHPNTEAAASALTTQLLHSAHSAGFPVSESLADFTVRHALAVYSDIDTQQPTLADSDFQTIFAFARSLILPVSPQHPVSSALRTTAEHNAGALAFADALQTLKAARRRHLHIALARLSRAKSNADVYGVIEALCLDAIVPIQPVPLDQARPAREIPDAAVEVQASLSSVLPKEEARLFRDMVLAENSTSGSHSVSLGPSSGISAASSSSSAAAPAGVLASGASPGVDQLAELVDIVAGIRLLNLPNTGDLDRVSSGLVSLANQVAANLHESVTLFTDFYHPLGRYLTEHPAAVHDPTLQPVARRVIAESTAALALQRALLALYRATLGAADETRLAVAAFSQTLASVTRLIAGRAAVPKGEVYPEFIELATHYRAVTAAGIALATLSTSVRNVRDVAATKFICLRDHLGAPPIDALTDPCATDGKAATIDAANSDPSVMARVPLDHLSPDILSAALRWVDSGCDGSVRLEQLTAAAATLTHMRDPTLPAPPGADIDAATFASLLPDWVTPLSSFVDLSAREIARAPQFFGGMSVSQLCGRFVSRPGLLVPAFVPAVAPQTASLPVASNPVGHAARTLVPPSTPSAAPAVASGVPSVEPIPALISGPISDAAAQELSTSTVVLPGNRLLTLAPEDRVLLAAAPLLFFGAPLCIALAGTPEFAPLVQLLNVPDLAKLLLSPELEVDRKALLRSDLGPLRPILFPTAEEMVTPTPDFDVRAGLLGLTSQAEQTDPATGAVVFVPSLAEVLTTPFLTQVTALMSSIPADKLAGTPFSGVVPELTPLSATLTPVGTGTAVAISHSRTIGVQTPVHFVESFIDPDYDPSEWRLRQRAVRLADLTNRATHSAQTAGASHFRRDAAVDAAPPVSNSTQTAHGTGIQAGPTFTRHIGGTQIASDVRDAPLTGKTASTGRRRRRGLGIVTLTVSDI
jgi:hypothetical protein